MSSNTSIINISQLLAQIAENELYIQFATQLQKDINRAGIDYTLQKTSDPLELVQEFTNLIQNLLSYNFNEFLNLLYAVDISEKRIKEVISKTSLNMTNQISFMILHREWKKVIFRNQK